VIKPTPAAESESDQAWDWFTEEPGVRNLGALRSDEFEGWMVTLWVMEHIGYEDPSEPSTEVGSGVDGRVLLLAAAQVVDDLADQDRPYAG
jgi:hypothetical protein